MTERDKFWGWQNHRDIYNLFKEGKKIEEIAETMGMRPDTVVNIVTNDAFRARLEKYLAAKVYMQQTASILAMEDMSKRLWDKVKNNMNDIPTEICLKELTKLISSKGNTNKVINPKQFNMTFNEVKDAPEKAKEFLSKVIDADMGYEPLPDKPDEAYAEPVSNPSVDTTKAGTN
jgi:DNA-binding CsgD family transcriptional regulator